MLGGLVWLATVFCPHRSVVLSRGVVDEVWIFSIAFERLVHGHIGQRKPWRPAFVASCSISQCMLDQLCKRERFLQAALPDHLQRTLHQRL